MLTATPHYDLKAEMARKGLTLRTVARRAGVGYTRASEILSGIVISPRQLESLKFTIKNAKAPRGASA